MSLIALPMVLTSETHTSKLSSARSYDVFAASSLVSASERPLNDFRMFSACSLSDSSSSSSFVICRCSLRLRSNVAYNCRISAAARSNVFSRSPSSARIGASTNRDSSSRRTLTLLNCFWLYAWIGSSVLISPSVHAAKSASPTFS